MQRTERVPAWDAGHLAGRGVEIIDVRDESEFRSGHLPDARNVPLGEIKTEVRRLDPTRPVAVICETGNRSLEAAYLLAHHGIMVYQLDGGMEAARRARSRT